MVPYTLTVTLHALYVAFCIKSGVRMYVNLYIHKVANDLSNAQSTSNGVALAIAMCCNLGILKLKNFMGTLNLNILNM